MFKSNRLNYIVRLWSDILVLLLCFVLAFYKTNGTFSSITQMSVLKLVGISLLIWYFGARIFLLYGEITIFSYSREMIVFIRQLATHLLLLSFVIFVFFESIYSYRSLIFYYHVYVFLIIPIEKYLYRLCVAVIRAQYKYEKNILIVGAGPLAANFYKSRILNNNLKYNLVGVVDDHSRQTFNHHHLGKIKDLPEILDVRNIDEVFLALPNDESKKIEYVIDVCEQHSIRVNLIQDITRLGSTRFNVTNYAGFPVVGIRYFPLDDPENRFFKRVFDLIFATLFLLFVYSLLYPIVAIIIKLNSSGPVLFKQERWGLNNKKIICYKFRTMYVETGSKKEKNIFKQASRNDNRVTSIGRFLRKSSIDELPQFLNVLLGNMSVVGPRPHPIPLSIESKDIVQNYMLRHLVKPGITGWAQVNGSRGETSLPDDMPKRVSFDLWYIENWSFWLDIQIILQTFINLVKGDQNAY